ncbi:MAG: hypothetical protein ACRETA_09745 [Gammaproteobacteria bacterium]
MAKNHDSKVDEDYDTVCDMADRLGLKNATRADYIDKHMRGLGYKPRITYVTSPDSKDDNDDFFKMPG